MGEKRPGGKKHIYLCIAILILLSPLACAFDQIMSTKMTDVSGEDAMAHLILGRKFFAEGKFGSALMENEKVLLLAGRNSPIDEALFTIGLIHAYPDNLARDYGKSLIALEKLIKGYPESPLVPQAKVIMRLIQDSDNLSRRVERQRVERAKAITVLTQENDERCRSIEKLSTIIDELKRVDIDVDQKKREMTK
jgi:hypothetical protein